MMTPLKTSVLRLWHAKEGGLPSNVVAAFIHTFDPLFPFSPGNPGSPRSPWLGGGGGGGQLMINGGGDESCQV